MEAGQRDDAWEEREEPREEREEAGAKGKEVERQLEKQRYISI